MAPGTRPRAGRWGWIQAQAGQADDSNGLVTWNQLRKRGRSPKRLLGRPRVRSEPLSRRVTQTGMGNGTATSLVRAMDKHGGAIGSRALPNKEWVSLDSRCVIERHDDQRFRWSERMWSPPPESNRRPHPYPRWSAPCVRRRPLAAPHDTAAVVGT